MKFVFGKQDMPTLSRAQEHCWLLTNGLGGYASASAAFSVSRNDQGILIAAETAPSKRITLVHRVSDGLVLGNKRYCLSSQEFVGNTKEERGFEHLTSFVWDNCPCWQYDISGVSVRRKVVLSYGENTAAVLYTVENRSLEPCTLEAAPKFLCSSKGQVRKTEAPASWDGKAVTLGGYQVYVRTDGQLKEVPHTWETLYYADDEKDGRDFEGMDVEVLLAAKTVLPGETATMELVFSMDPICKSGEELEKTFYGRVQELLKRIPFQNDAARQLALSADAYVTRRDSTGGKTIVAGYPFFGDWGRDTMIATPGCVLSLGDYETARSILRTFLAYEKDGLVPNLFPDGDEEPRYNTVDAALLLLNCLWLYHEKTGDDAFIRDAWPVMERITAAYQKGTHHGISMDADGLIRAGQGLDQVTWMDVCVDGILPTPRHGKPVEVNAYWYNALRIMEAFAPLADVDGTSYGFLAEKVKESFREQFWMPEAGYLKDVISGTSADTQLRCNQIWAVTMPFTMLTREQEKQVVEAVGRKLYTPCGLRTLSPDDPEFHSTYGGVQKERDLAYHQGTVWVFPLGAYYRALLKVNDFSALAAAQVRRHLDAVEPMLREGCVGQLPEIYDGLHPGASKGCFAQAWSVGEMLTVYELLEKIESGAKKGKEHAE